MSDAPALPASRLKSQPLKFPAAVLLMLLVFFFAGCKRMAPLNIKPLDAAGMSYPTIKKLVALPISPEEVTELVKARGAGISDDACFELVQIFHSRGKPFDAGDVVAGLVQAGVSPDTVLELAKLNQLGGHAGELEVMRLAGMSDQILLAEAQRRSQGKPALSGAALARMKNAGLRESTLLELVRRGVTDAQAEAILFARRHGAKDAEILRRFPGS